MKRIGVLFLLLAAILLVVPAAAAPPVHHATPWWHYDLKFWAPFDDARSPLKLLRGTGTLSFTRAHDATHTATYVHPGTGLVTVADNNQLRIEANGALIEAARTNSLLWSRAFDNEAWVATNTTVAKDQVGEDGVDNSAYTLTATGNNGTLCQAVTVASAAFSGAFSIKRISGTGAVQVSLDDGATWGASVAGSLSATDWYRASKSNQTLANPTLCLRLAVSGDTVTIDYAQLEGGAFPTSRIPTTATAMTRNPDGLQFSASGNISETAGSLFAIITVPLLGTGDNRQVLTNYRPMIENGSNRLAAYDGTNVAYGSAFVAGTPKKVAIRWSGAGIGATDDGGAVATASYDGAFGGTPFVGSANGTTDGFLWGHIKNFRIWNRALTDAELQNITR